MGSEESIVEAQEPERHLLTVDEFLALDEAGFFDPLGTVELLEGEIFVLSPLYSPHGLVTANLSADLVLAVRRLDLELAVHSPVSAWMDDHSLPQPDILVSSRPTQKWVTPDLIRLVVEVSHTSRSHDLKRKAALYARTRVPEYWVADTNERRIVRLHAPGGEGEGYAARREFAFGEPVPSATIDGLVVDTVALA